MAYRLFGILYFFISSIAFSQKLPRYPREKTPKFKIEFKQHHVKFKSYLAKNACDSLNETLNNQVTKIELVTLNPVPFPYFVPNYPDSLKKIQPDIFTTAISLGHTSVDTNRFSNQYSLSNKQIKRLLIAIYGNKKERIRLITSLGCYEPRHAFVFYNAKHEIIAYFEICLTCHEFRQSGPIPEIDRMTTVEYEKMSRLIESIVSE